jgi:hypothetical protein
MDAALEQWLEDTEDVRRARRRVLLRDRAETDRYVEVVFFDSYEDAMHNSSLPATTALSARFVALAEEFTFTDLDVVTEEM